MPSAPVTLVVSVVLVVPLSSSPSPPSLSFPLLCALLYASCSEFVSLTLRAVHPYFLLLLQSTAPGGKAKCALGELTILDVVMQYIKEQTEEAQCDYILAERG